MFYSANVDMINTTVSQNTDNADNSAIKNQDGNLALLTLCLVQLSKYY